MDTQENNDDQGAKKERPKSTGRPELLLKLIFPFILAFCLLLAVVTDGMLFRGVAHVSEETRDVPHSSDASQEESGRQNEPGEIRVIASSITPKLENGTVAEIETGGAVQLDGGLAAPGESNISGTVSIWDEDSKKFANAELAGSVVSMAANHQQRFQFTGDGQTMTNGDAVYIVLSGTVQITYEAEPDSALPETVSYPIFSNNLLISLEENTKGQILSGEICIGYLTQPDQPEQTVSGVITMRGKLSIFGSLEDRLYPTKTVVETVRDQYYVVNMEEAKSYGRLIATNVLSLISFGLLRCLINWVRSDKGCRKHYPNPTTDLRHPQ